MATETIVVPNGPGRMDTNTDERNRFFEEVSTYLDAGDDVEFVDEDGNDAEIEQMHLSVDGNVKSRTLSQADGDAISMFFLAGGWHTNRAHFIFASGTDSGLSLSVRMIQKPA